MHGTAYSRTAGPVATRGGNTGEHEEHETYNNQRHVTQPHITASAL